MTQHDSGAHLGAEATRVLAALGDEPLHVEARGLLLHRPAAVVLLDRAGETDDACVHGFVFAAEHGMAIGFGQPPVALADELRDLADDHGMVQEGLELHLPLASSEEWLALPDAKSLGLHRVQVIPGLPPDSGEQGGCLEALVRHEYAVLESRREPLLETLPRALRAEFEAMRPWPFVVASLAGESIASIASAFVETESYFDVSIDTVSDFRRFGFGAACAAALILEQRKRGKQPVWMVREKNRGSLALSSKLGFRDVGRVQGLRLL